MLINEEIDQVAMTSSSSLFDLLLNSGLVVTGIFQLVCLLALVYMQRRNTTQENLQDVADDIDTDEKKSK